MNKVADGYRPFVDKAHEVAVTIPEILPAVFPREEFLKDWELVQALTPILNTMDRLVKSLSHTVLAANSDALTESLEVYNAVKQHKTKVPGLVNTHDQLAAVFQRTRRKTDSVTASASTAQIHAPDSGLASVN